MDELLEPEILDATLDDIAAHVQLYNIHMQGLDSNKLVNYLAWHVLKVKGFNATPLFYAYFHYLDETRPGLTLWNIPKLLEICENLTKFHANGHKLGPYLFLKGVNLTFEHVLPPLQDEQFQY